MPAIDDRRLDTPSATHPALTFAVNDVRFVLKRVRKRFRVPPLAGLFFGLNSGSTLPVCYVYSKNTKQHAGKLDGEPCDEHPEPIRTRLTTNLIVLKSYFLFCVFFVSKATLVALTWIEVRAIITHIAASVAASVAVCVFLSGVVHIRTVVMLFGVTVAVQILHIAKTIPILVALLRISYFDHCKLGLVPFQMATRARVAISTTF